LICRINACLIGHNDLYAYKDLVFGKGFCFVVALFFDGGSFVATGSIGFQGI
jgi:hypothetical protein